MYAQVAYGRAPWATGDVPNTSPPGQQIPPPVPGGTTSFIYTDQRGAAPYGVRSWAGGSQVPVWPGSGIVLVPDPEHGVVAVQVWWPDTAAMLLVRITPDGVRTPVRGGYPVRPIAATRRNLCTNPGLEAGLNGYVPSDGAPTLTTIAGPVGSNALRATVAGAGSLGVTIPHSAVVTPDATIGVTLRFSGRPSAVTISVAYTNSAGGALTASAVSLTADQINESVGTWSRYVVAVQAPAGAAVVGSIKVLAAGVAAGGTADLDAVTIEQAQTSGSAFDGETLGGFWTGTRYLSTSVLAPVQTVLDGEAPLDVGLRYEAYNPSLVGGRISAGLVVLSSLDRTWLTHPADPGSPFVVQPSGPPPARTFDAAQGTFYTVGRSRPIVVSAAQRRSAMGTFAFGTLDVAERTRLLDALADLAPVLLRTPYGYEPGDMWMSFGAITIDPQGRLPSQPTRLVSGPFVEVDAPDPAVTG